MGVILCYVLLWQMYLMFHTLKVSDFHVISFSDLVASKILTLYLTHLLWGTALHQTFISLHIFKLLISEHSTTAVILIPSPFCNCHPSGCGLQDLISHDNKIAT